MIIVCQKCDSRLQVDDAKVPTRPFVIRCPKCNSSVDSGLSSATLEQGATSLGGSPATEHPRFDEPTPAPLFELESKATVASSEGVATERLAELLAGLLNQTPDPRPQSCEGSARMGSEKGAGLPPRGTSRKCCSRAGRKWLPGFCGPGHEASCRSHAREFARRRGIGSSI